MKSLILFLDLRKGDAALFDAQVIRFSSIWIKKTGGLSWSQARLRASDWPVPRIWLGVVFAFTVLRGEQPKGRQG
jgi:hypothetical protein